MILLLQTVYSPETQEKRFAALGVANLGNYAVLSGVSPLHAAAFGGPVGKPLQLVAVLPCQLEKFRCGHVCRFFA
jgi:hypothetical protein